MNHDEARDWARARVRHNMTLAEELATSEGGAFDAAHFIDRIVACTLHLRAAQDDALALGTLESVEGSRAAIGELTTKLREKFSDELRAELLFREATIPKAGAMERVLQDYLANSAADADTLMRLAKRRSSPK